MKIVYSRLIIIFIAAMTISQVFAETSSSHFSECQKVLARLESEIIKNFSKDATPSNISNAFTDSQDAWELYRKEQSHFEAISSSTDPSIYKTRYLEVYTRITKERIQFLMGLLPIDNMD
jgi:uncharacterized protein YecT (DUF1311 family)